MDVGEQVPPEKNRFTLDMYDNHQSLTGMKTHAQSWLKTEGDHLAKLQ